MSKEQVRATAKARGGHEKINWLDSDGWRAVRFPGDPDDDAKIRETKKVVRGYVRGCLAMYNQINGTHFVVTEFHFERKSTSPLEYEVTAFLEPPVTRNGGGKGHDHEDDERGGSHLVPQEPIPPDNLS